MQLASYPHNPGSKDSHGSLEAAIAITKSGKHHCDKEIVEWAYRITNTSMAADEAWEIFAKGKNGQPDKTDLHSFRSRVSELTRSGVLKKLTDERGKSITGKSVSRYIWAGYVAPQYSYDDVGQGVLWMQ